MNWYTTLLFPGGVYRKAAFAAAHCRYTTLLFLGGVYPAQVFSSPKRWLPPLT